MRETPGTSEHPASATSGSRSRSRWILGRWPDLLLFVGTPILIAPLVLAARSRFNGEDIFLFVSTFGALGHHAPGLMRAYGDRALFRRFRLRFLVVPIVAVVVCTIFTLENMSGVMLVLLTWGVWHFLMQTYGFARIYDAKVGCHDATTRRLDLAMCLAWFGGSVLFADDRVREFLALMYQSGFPVVAEVPLSGLRIVWAAGIVLITTLFVFNLIRKAVRGETLNPVKLLLLGATFLFFWMCTVTFTNLIIGVAMFEVYHDIQYLAIVWMFNRNRARSDTGVGAFTRFLFRRSGALIGLYIGIVLAYGSIGFIAEHLTSEGLQKILFGIIGASNILHFYYDGFIWKVREPATRQPLGVAAGRAGAGNTGWLPGWFAHGLKWLVLGVIVLGLAAAEKSGTASELDRARAIVATTPDSVVARTTLAKLLIDQSRFEEAIEQCRVAEQLEAGHYKTHVYWGVALAATGNSHSAIDRLEQAFEMHPRDAYLRFHLAMAYLQIGRFDQAAEHFEASLAIRPDDPDVHYNLGQIRAMQGRLEEASGHFSQAIEYDPQHIFAMSSLAEMSRLQGNNEEAVRLYQATLHLDAAFPNAHYGLAAALRTGGQPVEANAHLTQAIESLLSKELRSARETDLSIRWAEELVSHSTGQDALALDLLARSYAAAQRYAEAIETARSAAEFARQDGQQRFADEIDQRIETYERMDDPR